MNGDLKTWLKAAAENKITTKNTWKSTLIDHFSNVDEFRENQGINFQKASCTLDGCVKVYSTRVDDVSENAVRLLEGFNEEGHIKKKERRQTRSTIERNISNLNIKTNGSRTDHDPKFLYLMSLPETDLLINHLISSPDGILRMSLDGMDDVMIMDDMELLIDVPRNMMISPSVGGYEEERNVIMDPVVEEEQFQDDSIGFDESFGFEDVPIVNDNQKPVFKESEFSYFKGWAGPSHWKIRCRRTKNQVTKPKEIFFMNFMDPIDHETLMESGNTLFEQSFILKRREIEYTLPPDFRFGAKDLYRYLVRDGFFGSIEADTEDIESDAMIYESIMDGPVDEFIIDPIQERNQNNVIPFRRTAKRVDIKRLKENIFRVVENGCTNLKSIFKRIPNMYEEESKDITIHLCFVSLLHLANERNIELKHIGNDIEIDLR